jgi:ubiquinone/menaquinone biosynthesis C-methylase UbiE
MRKVTEQVASTPAAWTPERAAEVESFFDELADEWHTRSDPHRNEPVLDAYDRGAVPTAGVTLEVGSGTGLLTTTLAERSEIVIALDLSFEMLRHATADLAPRVQGDASRFPFPDGAINVAVFINAFLFAEETARVLAPDGVVVWVNTSGDKTPIYLSADDVDAALPGQWTGVASEAGWGTWAVLRRA